MRYQPHISTMMVRMGPLTPTMMTYGSKPMSSPQAGTTTVVSHSRNEVQGSEDMRRY